MVITIARRIINHWGPGLRIFPTYLPRFDQAERAFIKSGRPQRAVAWVETKTWGMSWESIGNWGGWPCSSTDQPWCSMDCKPTCGVEKFGRSKDPYGSPKCPLEMFIWDNFLVGIQCRSKKGPLIVKHDMENKHAYGDELWASFEETYEKESNTYTQKQIL